MVAQTSVAGARPPFWKGEIKGRRNETGLAYGEILRNLGRAHSAGSLQQELSRLGLDDNAAEAAQEFIKNQIAVTGALPDDRTILIEHFRDDDGLHQVMVHSVFGRPVNEPLAILATEAAKRLLKCNVGYVVDDDGFLLFPYEDRPLPDGLLYAILPEAARSILEAALPATPLFNMAFRYNAARALMMGSEGRSSASMGPALAQRGNAGLSGPESGSPAHTRDAARMPRGLLGPARRRTHTEPDPRRRHPRARKAP